MLKQFTLRENGVGLLELMLVLLIAGIIIAASARYYFIYKRTAAIGMLESGVSQIMDGLNNYYYINCKNNAADFPNVTIDKLMSARLVPNNINDFNRYGTYDVKINQNTNTQLQVIATVNEGHLADLIRSVLNADPAQAGSLTITWTRLPNHNTDDLNSHQWVMNEGPGQLTVPGRTLTAVNEGNRSKFWLLDSDRRAFSVMMGRSDACVN